MGGRRGIQDAGLYLYTYGQFMLTYGGKLQYCNYPPVKINIKSTPTTKKKKNLTTIYMTDPHYCMAENSTLMQLSSS